MGIPRITWGAKGLGRCKEIGKAGKEASVPGKNLLRRVRATYIKGKKAPQNSINGRKPRPRTRGGGRKCVAIETEINR